MFDFSRKVEIQKARHALREGRLDEAYELVTAEHLQQHRQCQVLREQLVEPLLERARDHFEHGRLEAAQADIERARTIGGRRREVVALHEEVFAARADAKRAQIDERAAIDSAKRHVVAGELTRAGERLLDVKEENPAHGRLERQLRLKREEIDMALARVRHHLQNGEIGAAADAARQLLEPAGRDAAARELIDEVKKAAERTVREAWEAGRLERVRDLAARLNSLAAGGASSDDWSTALGLADEAAAAVAGGDWSAAKLAVGRLRTLHSKVPWIKEAEAHLRQLEERLYALRCGPLGEPPKAKSDAIDETQLVAPPLAGGAQAVPVGALGGAFGGDFGGAFDGGAGAPARSPLAPQQQPKPRSQDRVLMLIDGIGSYLVLAGSRITLGRVGSSARPDVALNADLEGIHAEIVRTDGDYFLLARGAVNVAGRPVEKHLLADGDEVELGRRASFKFRLPTSLSTTAVLELATSLRLSGDVRRVVLLDQHLVVGKSEDCHITAQSGPERLVLSRSEAGFRVKSSDPLVIDQKVLGERAEIGLDTCVETGGLTFTMTAASAGEGPADGTPTGGRGLA